MEEIKEIIGKFRKDKKMFWLMVGLSLILIAIGFYVGYEPRRSWTQKC